MTLKEFSSLSSSIQSLLTSMSLVVGGWWVYRRYIRQEEKYPNIEFTADINVVGEQANYWIIELLAYVENKGKVQHKMKEFLFDLNALMSNDPVNTSAKWRGQVDFINPISKGSFLSNTSSIYFIDPGIKAKYSYITSVPKETSFLILHCTFKYVGRGNYRHTAEKTIQLQK